MTDLPFNFEPGAIFNIDGVAYVHERMGRGGRITLRALRNNDDPEGTETTFSRRSDVDDPASLISRVRAMIPSSAAPLDGQIKT